MAVDDGQRHPRRDAAGLNAVQYLALAFGICLACSALGFIRVVYFVSLGYAASMAAQACAAAFLYAELAAGWPLAQVCLLLAYGLRLGSYLILRNFDRGYEAHQRTRGVHSGAVTVKAKVGIWVGVAGLYVLMALPTFLTLSADARGLPLAMLPYGVALMAAGLAIESIADLQKFRFKAVHPGHFCNTGLYRIVRCPNYLGEMLFWCGLWLSATDAYQGWLEWSMCSLGLTSILGIMIGATRRLEGEQAEHYAASGEYATYSGSVPVLFPWVPIYTLRHRAVAPS